MKFLREPLIKKSIQKASVEEYNGINGGRCHWGSKFAFQWQGLKFFGGGSFRGLDTKGMDAVIDCGANIQQNREAPAINDGYIVSQSDNIIRINWADGAEPHLTVEDWNVLLRNLEQLRLQSGKDILNVLVCCVGGHGRTGTALAILAALTGIAPTNPVNLIRKEYCYKSVETISQCRYIRKITQISQTDNPSQSELDTSCESSLR